MKHKVTRFKSLKLALKELEQFIRDGMHLRTGKPFKNFDGLRSREILANWLICVAVDSEKLTFTSDPTGGDGIIFNNETQQTWPTEHVSVMPFQSGEQKTPEARILEAIESKQKKGRAAYASGKTLVVFLEGVGEWLPNRVARQLPKPLDFEDVWVVGLQGVEEDEYVYSVTQLDLSHGNTPAWLVRITKNFDDWKVNQIQ